MKKRGSILLSNLTGVMKISKASLMVCRSLARCFSKYLFMIVASKEEWLLTNCK